jgi:hypothetical protein
MRSRVFYFALALIMGTIGLVAALALDGVREMAADLEQAKTNNAKTNAELVDQKEDSAALWAQVKRLGGKPVVDPPAVPAQGERGPGPTDAQVKAAVADYCAGDRCKPTVSRSQVAAAVAAYCAGGLCQGKDGTDGGPGADGTDGTNGADGADGAPGPGPTDEQIAAAVEAYCDGGGNCGEDGADGQDGKDGADGKDATFTPSGMDCPDGERVSGVHLLADGSLTVSCAPLLSR